MVIKYILIIYWCKKTSCVYFSTLLHFSHSHNLHRFAFYRPTPLPVRKCKFYAVFLVMHFPCAIMFSLVSRGDLLNLNYLYISMLLTTNFHSNSLAINIQKNSSFFSDGKNVNLLSLNKSGKSAY